MSLLKLKLILWKNYIIRKRHWFLTCCEVVFPVSLFLLVAYGRSQMNMIGKKTIDTVSYGQLYHTTDIYSSYMSLENRLLLYSPDTNFTNELITSARVKLNVLYEGTSVSYVLQQMSYRYKIFQIRKVFHQKMICLIIMKSMVQIEVLWQ